MFDKDTEDKIRLEYEYGFHLKDLAIKYKVPLPTLKSRKKKSELNGDPWIKGIKAKIKYEDMAEDRESIRQKLLKRINDKARKELEVMDAELESAYKSEDLNSIRLAEVNYNMRMKRIHRTLGLKKEIEGIYPDKEEAEIKKIRIEIEIKKQELEEKRLDYEVKKLTADHYLKKR